MYGWQPLRLCNEAIPVPKVDLKSAMKSAGLFALMGPPMGGAIVFCMDLLAHGSGSGTALNGSDVAGSLLFVGMFSYVFGIVTAFVTGFIAGLLRDRCRSWLRFVALCAALSVVVGFAVDGIIFKSAGAAFMLSLVGVLPAVAVGSLCWCRRSSP